MEKSEPRRTTSKVSGFSRLSVYSDKHSLILSPRDVIVLNKDHLPQLLELVSQDSINMFGNVDIYGEMYSAFVTLGVLSPESELVGAVVLKNYPNVKSVPSWCWLQWMRHLFGCESVNQSNCIWIHLLLWKEKYVRVFLKPMLQHYFEWLRYKQFVMVAIPPGVDSTVCLGITSSRIMPKGYVNPLTTTSLGLMARRFYVPTYKIRKAVEEDNDDIIPLIAKFSPSLHETYGNYYIAEMLTRFPDADRQVIVAEYAGYAVAVVIMNRVVNFDILNENFELVCFHGLKKQHEDDVVEIEPIEEIEVDDLDEDTLTCISESWQFAPKRTHSELSLEDLISIDENWEMTKSFVNLFVQNNEGMRDYHAMFDLNSYIMNEGKGEYKIKRNASSCWTLNHQDYEKHLYKEPDTNAWEEGATFKPVREEAPIPKFFGQPNAFFFEVVAAKDGHGEALELLVEAAFESFPDRNYCCITIPTTQVPLNVVYRFVKVPSRSRSTFPHDLFLMHRNTLQPEMVIRIALQEDEPYIEEFLNQIREPGNIREQVKFAMTDDPTVENSSYLCFLMTAYKQIVGLAVLNENVEVEYLLSHYELYRWVDTTRQKMDSYAIIETFLLYPIFSSYSLFFLTQMQSIADYSVLFYLLTQEDMSGKKTRLICNAIQHLVPVPARVIQNYSPKHLKGDLMPAEHIRKRETPYSVFLSMIGLSSIPRIEINTKLVIVGSGRTAASFLEAFLRTTSTELFITFSGVVVVSPKGFNYAAKPNRTRDMFFVRKTNSCRQNSNWFRTHLSYTAGIVTEIKRQDKRIYLSDGTFLPYDILAIMAGEQYQAPILKKGSYSEMPLNLFVLNTDADVRYALKTLNDIMIKDINPEGKVIVYGHDIRCHCALAALREFRIPSELLVYVNPINNSFDAQNLISYDQLIYDDPEVDIAMLRILQKEGVTLYKGFFDDWVVNELTNLVTEVKFECFKQVLELKCKCIFMFSEKHISKKIFQAVANAGLVFDGRLVIDANFRTNDPYIYAAGPVTKYSRKYHADHMSHFYYSSEEIGETFGLYMRNFLIPADFKAHRSLNSSGLLEKLEEKRSVLPTFSKPLLKVCTVIGNLNYCHISKPGKQIATELEATRANFGQLYVTGDLDNLDKQGYFRIHINEVKEVETITCLTKDEIYVNSLMQIWGKHVKMLNNLQVRFELMMIPDLFEFFKEPWTCAIYLDRFKETRQAIKRSISETPLFNFKSLVQTVHDLLKENEWDYLSQEQKIEVLQLFNQSDLRNKIEEQVVEYIEKNAMELPMYAYPSLLRSILHDYEKSPMFSD